MIANRCSRGTTSRKSSIRLPARLNVDVIVTVGSAVPTVRHATSTIPIVFAVGIDPVGTGLVASLDGAVLDPAEFAQARDEGICPGAESRGIGTKESYCWQLSRLLRTHRHRPRSYRASN
jgi:hypothetical protein